MKISKLFHWLYATLLFLPLLVAPIFGIYSHRHTIDSYSVTIPQNLVVDFNQYVRNGDFTTLAFWTATNGEKSVSDNIFSVETTSSSVEVYQRLPQKVLNHKYYYTFDYRTSVALTSGFNTIVTNKSLTELTANTWHTFEYLESNGEGDMYFDLFFYSNDVFTLDLRNCWIVDLSKMYGLGNEPTLEQFRQRYDEDYYNYTLSTKELIENVGTITYGNTDIGSQFVYTIYGTLDNYFNMQNLLPFRGLSSWIQLEFFNGNFTLGFYIFYNLFLYWLLISILWLIFDVLMYVPNLVHRWLDRGAIE